MKGFKVLIEFGELVIEHPWESIIFIIILLLMMCIIYRKSRFVQKMINYIPFTKKEYIVMSIFTKHKATFRNVTEKFALSGYKSLKIDYCKKFRGEFSEKDLQKMVDKQYKKMCKVKNEIKDTNSLIYLGFPHIPFALFDGKNFSATDNTILYEYRGSYSNSSEKKFFELETVYNSDIEILSNYSDISISEKEIILKIEQSFSIKDAEINSVAGDWDIIYLKNKDIQRWGISSYAEVDKFATEFYNVLEWCKEQGIEKIHLAMTTPVSLTFSLGKVIEHYHPDIVIYNYNNNKFDWCIDMTSRKVKIIN